MRKNGKETRLSTQTPGRCAMGMILRVFDIGKVGIGVCNYAYSRYYAFTKGYLCPAPVISKYLSKAETPSSWEM